MSDSEPPLLSLSDTLSVEYSVSFKNGPRIEHLGYILKVLIEEYPLYNLLKVCMWSCIEGGSSHEP